MSKLPETVRSGVYFRVCTPDWIDCADTSFAKAQGGRWNPPGEFGALYLNQTKSVAAANARRQHAGRAIGLFDLRPARRPDLAEFPIAELTVLDVVSGAALDELELPPDYPVGVGRGRCHAIARRAYAQPLAGVAALSAAEPYAAGPAGEELAIFDTHPQAPTKRTPFTDWYPDAKDR